MSMHPPVDQFVINFGCWPLVLFILFFYTSTRIQLITAGPVVLNIHRGGGLNIFQSFISKRHWHGVKILFCTTRGPLTVNAFKLKSSSQFLYVTKDRRILEPAAASAPVECMGAMTKDYANGFRGRPSWLANSNTFHYSAWQVHGRSDFSSVTPAPTSEGLPRASWSDNIIHPGIPS